MESLIIGEGSLDLRAVAKTIETSTSFTQLLRKWRLFGEELGLKDEVLLDLQRKLKDETYEMSDLPRKILKIWKANQGTKATLQKLCDALEDCGVRDIAEAFSSKVDKIRSENTPHFDLQGKVYTWEQLVDKFTLSHEQLYQRAKDMFKQRPDLPMQLIREEVSPKETPEYYISRTLIYKTQLDEQIFKHESTKEHIFVVKGASKSELARVSGFQMIESSRNQSEQLTVRFVLLDSEDDFENICKNTSRPVHMIEYKDNGFFWVQSTESLEVIRMFLKETPTTFSEDEIIARITLPGSPTVLSIADSPGMGKTFVLTNLAAKIKKVNAHSITIFIILQEFMKQTQPQEHSSALDLILSYACTNHVKKCILQEMLKGNTFQLFLFLDGYDEVLQNELPLVDYFLKRLIKVQNMKVIVTTRPHFIAKLETVLNQLSYEILPFDERNQIEFLKKYWVSKHGAYENENLQKFAKKCLDALKLKITDQERSIAGIPLQCRMLAEVYAEDAKRASENDVLPEDLFEEITFFKMYKTLINLKFSRISDPQTRQKYMDAHIYDSIALLFPNWLEKFKVHLHPRDEIDENTLYSIGLIEKSPSSNTPRFVHRTFAEYICGDFIARNPSLDNISIEFIILQVLGLMGLSEGTLGWSTVNYELRYPVTAYFLNMHLHNRFKEYTISTSTILPQNITKVDVLVSALVCCSNDLESCFNLIANIVPDLNIKHEKELRDQYFNNLLHVVLANTNNVSFVERVLNLTKSESGVKLCNQFYKTMAMGKVVENFTPLHVAINQGKYNIVMYLLQEYGPEVLSMRCLLHACVYDSAKNKEPVIDEKLLILEALTELNREWLEEEYQGTKPLLVPALHLTIAQHLVKSLGVDINTYSSLYGTVLHTATEKSSYSEVVHWALNNGFTLINEKNYLGVTPLMLAIRRFGTINHEVLQKFRDAGADFDAQDNEGNSLLFYAIKYSKSVDFIRKIIRLGVNINHRNLNQENSAHMIIQSFQDDPSMLKLFKSLVSKGFDGFNNSINSSTGSFSPIISALEKTTVINNGKLLKLFFEAAVESTDRNGDSILFHAIENIKDEELIRIIMEQGVKNLNHANKSAENAAPFVKKDDENNSKQALQITEVFGCFNK